MRAFGITLAIAALSATALMAQGRGTPPPTREYSSAADVSALMAEAKGEHKDGQALQTKRLLTLAPIGANLEYRTGVAAAAVHETEAEVFYVIDGSATMVTGGKLTEEKRTNPENLSGTGIENGNSREIAKGDFIIVPQGVPHWFSKINGTLVLMSLHVPRTTPNVGK
jgi:mannose-6-phosphate isomerase-like protein (cupin superfamily)